MITIGYEFECSVMAGSSEGALAEATKPFEGRQQIKKVA